MVVSSELTAIAKELYINGTLDNDKVTLMGLPSDSAFGVWSNLTGTTFYANRVYFDNTWSSGMYSRNVSGFAVICK